MRRLLLLLIPLTLAAPPPAPAAPSDCGESAELPAFALSDVNPNSPGYGQEAALDDFLGQVLVLYWAQAT